MNFSCRIDKCFLLPFLFILFLCPNIIFAQNPDSTDAWVKILADLEQYYVIVDNDFKDPYLIERGDSVRVDSGRHHISVVWRTINDHTFTINAKAGKTVERRIKHSFPTNPRSSYQTIVNQTNLFVTTDENSTVYIDGEQAGKHIVRTMLNPGRTYQLRIEHPEFGSLRKEVEVNSLSITQVARFNENPSNLSFAAKLIPGAEYIATNRNGKAVVTYLGLGLLYANLRKQSNLYEERKQTFMDLNDRYLSAQVLENIVYYRELASQANTKLEQTSRNYNITLALTGLLYILTTVDALRKPNGGYKGKSAYSKNTFSLRKSSSSGKSHVLLTYSYHFR